MFRSVGRVSSRGVVRMMTPPSVAEQKVVQTDVPMYNEDPEAVARGQMRPRAVDLTWDKVRPPSSPSQPEGPHCSLRTGIIGFVSPNGTHPEDPC